MENPRYPFHREFMQHLVDNLGSARNTLTTYGLGTKRFFEWLTVNHRFTDPKRLTKFHILGYRDYLKVARYGSNTIALRLRCLKAYLKFLVDFGHLVDTPFPTYINTRGKEKMPHLVPTPQEIFLIRGKLDVKLMWATLFELILSTGMREGEVMQTRACDLNFQDRPFDQELKRPSPFYAGSIFIKQTTHSTKNSMPRKVYFSYLAGILLKRYIGLYNIDPRVGLYPWSDSYLQDMIRFLGEGIIARTSADLISSGNSGAEIQRERGFTDLDITELNVSDDFKKALSRRQQEENSIEDYKRQASQPLSPKKRQLHPHALRHAFTNFCYYRTPLGTRRDEQNLRLLMGHNGQTSTTHYLKTLPLIQEDHTWNRLWMGKPEDWSGISR